VAKYSRKSSTTLDSDLDELSLESYYPRYLNDYDYDAEAEKADLQKNTTRLLKGADVADGEKARRKSSPIS